MLLMTQSLLSAWAYQYDCYEGGEEEAREAFLKTLRREKDEPTEAMVNGLEFESLVYLTAAGKTDPAGHRWENGARKLAAIIGDAPVQVKVDRPIEVDGTEYLLYGILDALKAGVIYDVKFSNKSFGSAEIAGKYLESAQHPAYFYLVPEAHMFKYLVSDGDDIYIETYERDQTRYIGDIISAFARDIRRDGLWDLYAANWQARQ